MGGGSGVGDEEAEAEAAAAAEVTGRGGARGDVGGGGGGAGEAAAAIYQAGNMVPHELAEFLADPSVRFVGVAVNNDMQRLANDCNLRVACAVDLRYAAAAVLGQPELARAGLKRLALTVMGAHMEKEKNITKSRWGEPTLTWEQVNYACIDAYVSYEIGRRLLSGEPILAAPL
uniref:3'-5' exonuclease domain-containing protein n=1 Tax=Oryza nivara TaxID=4536 RepID=A0A0E0FQI7_ORYNI